MGSGSGMPPRQKRRLSYPVGGHARSLLASSADLAVRAGAGLFGIADLIDVPAGVTDWRAHYGLVPTSFLSRARAMGSRWRCNPCARRSRHSRRCESAWSLLLVFHLDPGTEKTLPSWAGSSRRSPAPRGTCAGNGPAGRSLAAVSCCIGSRHSRCDHRGWPPRPQVVSGALLAPEEIELLFELVVAFTGDQLGLHRSLPVSVGLMSLLWLGRSYPLSLCCRAKTGASEGAPE